MPLDDVVHSAAAAAGGFLCLGSGVEVTGAYSVVQFGATRPCVDELRRAVDETADHGDDVRDLVVQLVGLRVRGQE